MRIVETPLDKLSNRALDAIEAGHYEQAEKLCRKLLRVYRKSFDGHARMAKLREAQERFQEAADHYAKLLTMIQKNSAKAPRSSISSSSSASSAVLSFAVFSDIQISCFFLWGRTLSLCRTALSTDAQLSSIDSGTAVISTIACAHG